MATLVADTSVLIDLEHGNLCKEALALPHEFLVPDYLYAKELADNLGPSLLALGLVVVVLGGVQVQAALVLQQQQLGLSLSDAFVIVLARERNAEVLSGDAVLRKVAVAENLACRGVLWLCDEIHARDASNGLLLHTALTTISTRPQCRLPPREVQLRLNAYKAGSE